MNDSLTPESKHPVEQADVLRILRTILDEDELVLHDTLSRRAANGQPLALPEGWTKEKAEIVAQDMAVKAEYVITQIAKHGPDIEIDAEESEEPECPN